MAAERTETFARAGGHVTAALGLVVAALMVVLGVVDHDNVPLWVPALGLLLAVLVWTSTIRPRVWVEPGTLVMRTMLDTIRIPLAAVEEVAVRQVMAVRAGGRRYVTSGTGRTLRQAMKGSVVERARQERGGLRAEADRVVEPGMVYGDYVELRLRDLVAEDRARRGVAAYSPELDTIAAETRREPAWVDVGALVASVAFLVVAVLV